MLCVSCAVYTEPTSSAKATLSTVVKGEHGGHFERQYESKCKRTTFRCCLIILPILKGCGHGRKSWEKVGLNERIRDLDGDLVRHTPVHNCLDSVLELGQCFHKSRELECSNEDKRAGCMVHNVFDGILSKGIIQGDTVG